MLWLGALLAFAGAPGARAAEKTWVPLLPERVSATDGAVLRHLGDGVILAEGENPERVTYEIDFRTERAAMSAFRLDVLPHASLPHGGPGRAPAANFVLSELELLVSHGRLGSKATPVVLREAAADHEQVGKDERFVAAMAIDGVVDDKNGWAGEGHHLREERVLIVVPQAPVGFPSGCVVTLRLRFESAYAQHAIGCFRLSSTDYPHPVSMYPTRRGPGDDEIARATERGLAWLLDRQLPDGSWPGPDTVHYFGMSALAAYTLLQCGMPKDHPSVRAAIAYVDHHPMQRTYDIGCALLTYQVLGDPDRAARVQELADRLIESVSNGSRSGSAQWGYPFAHEAGSSANHLDLSNTQYALLGLRAAAGRGVKVPAALWERVAKDVLDLQDAYGGFRYTPGREPSASMTTAGMACLLICRDALGGNRKQSRTRIDGALVRAENWLQANWSVEENLFVPRTPGGDSERWYYYYMYGLERVGALASTRMIAGHDWHAEGARALLRRQGDDGSWGSIYGERDANTCFALMYLIRGTRSTGRSERPRARAEADAITFSLQSNQGNPLEAWVDTLGSAVKERLAAGQRAIAVDWLVNGTVAHSVAAHGTDALVDRFPLRHHLPWNGAHEVIAAMRFADKDGALLGEVRSLPLSIRVDSVEEPRHREAIFDNAHGALDVRAVEVEASSALDGHDAARAADGRYGTSWVSAENDPRPTIDLRLPRPARAAAIKFAPAHPWLGAEAHWARPRDLEIQLNGGKAFRVTLIDDVRNKHGVAFAPTTIRRVRIRVLSVYPGITLPGAVGFKEIELIGQAPPDDYYTRVFHASDTLLAPGAEAATRWRHTTTQPDPTWHRDTYDDASWQLGAAPFASLDAPQTGRTAWDAKHADLWIRGTFELDGAPRGRLVIELASDDVAEVYVNGIPAAVNREYTRGSLRATAAAEAVMKSLQRGRNVITAHCRNTGGAAYLDVGLRVIQEGAPP